MIESNVLKQLLKNPHYKLNQKQREELETIEVQTQEVTRAQLTSPKVKRKKKSKKASLNDTWH